MNTTTFRRAATAATAAMLLGLTAAPAQAQFSGLKDFAKKEAEKKAKEEIRKGIDAIGTETAPASTPTATTSTATTSTAATSAGTPSSAPVRTASTGGAPKPVELTQCDTLRSSKIVVGQLGDYTFQNGMSTETKPGFVNRRSVSYESDCIVPNMRTHDILYIEFPTDALRSRGYPNAYETQCVKPDDRAYGSTSVTESRSEYPGNPEWLGEAYLRLACGSSEGISECTNGKNSDRATAAADDLKARGQTALTFLMTPTRRGTTPKTGERLYCQFYNKESGKSLVAWEYFREYG
ncbi:MAG: hypothetical protein WBF53_15725 [Litorimonas sp.]